MAWQRKAGIRPPLAMVALFDRDIIHIALLGMPQPSSVPWLGFPLCVFRLGLPMVRSNDCPFCIEWHLATKDFHTHGYACEATPGTQVGQPGSELGNGLVASFPFNLSRQNKKSGLCHSPMVCQWGLSQFPNSNRFSNLTLNTGLALLFRLGGLPCSKVALSTSTPLI